MNEPLDMANALGFTNVDALVLFNAGSERSCGEVARRLFGLTSPRAHLHLESAQKFFMVVVAAAARMLPSGLTSKELDLRNRMGMVPVEKGAALPVAQFRHMP